MREATDILFYRNHVSAYLHLHDGVMLGTDKQPNFLIGMLVL